MTDAYKCDRCGQFAEDRPAVDFDVEPLMRENNGNVYLPDGTRAEWSHRGVAVELCPSCAVPAIEWMNEHMKNHETS